MLCILPFLLFHEEAPVHLGLEEGLHAGPHPVMRAVVLLQLVVEDPHDGLLVVVSEVFRVHVVPFAVAANEHVLHIT